VNKDRIRSIDADLKEVGIVLGLTLIVFSVILGFPTIVSGISAPTGIVASQQFNPEAVNLDWDDHTPTPDFYNVFKGYDTTADNANEVNTNGTWQFREQRLHPTLDVKCSFTSVGSGSTGAFRMVHDGTGAPLGECYMWKVFPRSFINNTRIQIGYDFSNTISSNTATAIVNTVDDPNQPFRHDESEFPSVGSRSWTAGVFNVVDSSGFILNGGILVNDVVTPFNRWDLSAPLDSDYATVVIEMSDTNILSQGVIFDIFWINFTDYTTGLPVAFYNFSGSSRIFETDLPPLCNDPINPASFCTRGIINAGTTLLFDRFELIGTSTTSDFQDLNPNQGVEINYKVNAFSGISGFSNSGTLGTVGDAIYTEAGIDSTFVTTTGIINQGVIKNGTSSGDTDGEIIIGNSLTTWNFLHSGNVGDNVTSINFWLKGDVVGAPVYPILNTIGSDNQGSDAGWALWTQSGTNMMISIQESSTNSIEFLGIGTPPPDDSNWHMVTYVQDKGNTTGNWIVYCLDGACANVGSISAYDGLNPTNALFNMTVGGGTPFGNVVVQNTFDFDDFTIWQGYQLTQSDVNTMYNSGAGSTGGAIQSGSQVVHLSFDAGTETGGGSGTNSTLVPFTFNQQLSSPMGLTLTHDNVNMEIDLDWVDIAGADNYTVQRLSTERIIEDNNSLQGDNNFASGGNAVGDFASLSEGEIAVQVALKSGRFSASLPSGGVHFSGYWANVTIGVADINDINPTSRSEVEQTGFMVSAGTRLSRDCNAGGTGDPLTSSAFISPREQDGYTQNSDGEWIDYDCVVRARFLGNQLHNLTASEAVNTQITALSRVNTTSGGFSVIREGVGTGLFLSNKVTGLWTSTIEFETGTWKLNSTFIDLATTLTSDFTDTSTNNYNSYFYRIIANNAGGGSQASDIVNGTLSVRPNRVNDLNGTDNGSTVDLIWEEATEKFSRIGVSNDPIQGYIIQRAPANETTLYDGLIHDVEEFFIRNDGGVTIATGQGSGSGGAPSYGSDVSFGGQMLNITQPVNITRMVVKIGVSDGRGFNAEPDLAGAIYFENGTAVARTIFPRIANHADMEKWSTTKEDQENFVNWAFSPPVQLQPAEYMFGWDSLNTQMCNSASCGLGNADVGDYEVFFENTGYQQGSAGFAVGAIQSNSNFYKNPINNSKVNDYAMAIYVEPVWTTIGTNLGVSNTSFTDNSPPIGVTKAYRILAFNDAGISHPPTLLHNPQGTLLGKMGNSTDFFPKDSQGRNRAGGLIVGEVLTFEVTTPPVPTAITDLVASVVGEQCNLSWTVPSGSITGHRILRAVDGGNFVELIANSGTSGTHSDLGLVIASLYQYDVRALNAQGEALSSNIESCTPIASGVAPAPTGLTASNLPNGNVQLLWDNPNNPSISGYQIERKLENGAFIIIPVTTVKSLDVELLSGSKYSPSNPEPSVPEFGAVLLSIPFK